MIVLEKENIPKHVGIIMDGNGRWAQERGLKRSLGHKAGSENLKKLCMHIYDRGVSVLSVFAFSTENFKRNSEEVSYLMNLFVQMFQKEFLFLKEKGIRVVFSGRIEMFPKIVQQAVLKITEETKDGENGILNICLGYGGQYEILDMTKKIASQVLDGKLLIENIDLEDVRKNLYQELPDLDLVIRTSGEIRMSNFMLYQSAYAEWYFPKTYFPDFDENEFDLAILEYQRRTRKFGG